MKTIAKAAILLITLFPTAAFAQGRIVYLLGDVSHIVNVLIGLVAAIALLVFFWGLVKFISTTSAEGKAEGKSFMIWGVIALFVMVSVWGLVRFIQGEVLSGVDMSNPTAPNVNRPR